MHRPIFALIDCNSFYCSCERVFQPKLNNKPVAVLSNNDGCIIARSNEVKSLDVKVGANYHEYKDILKKNNTYVFSSNYQLYGDISQRVMTIIKQFAPEFEIYSIDEAFIRIEKFSHYNLYDYACEIRNRILKWTGIPVSIGIGHSKTLAKIANKIAKKRADSYVFNLCNEEIKNDVLKNFEIEDLWGVGRRSALKLRLFNIGNAYDLSKSDIRWVRKHFTVTGERMVREIRGESCIDLENISCKKSIITSKSFGQKISDKNQIFEALANYSFRACEKLRKQRSKCRAIQVFAYLTDTNHKNRFYQAATGSLQVPSCDTSKIMTLSEKILEQIYIKNVSYLKVGIILLDITPDHIIQEDFFSNQDDPQKLKIMHIIDSINSKMGKNTVTLACQGKKHPWAMKCQYRSPRYTTSWSELLQIKS